MILQSMYDSSAGSDEDGEAARENMIASINKKQQFTSKLALQNKTS